MQDHLSSAFFDKYPACRQTKPKQRRSRGEAERDLVMRDVVVQRRAGGLQGKHERPRDNGRAGGAGVRVVVGIVAVDSSRAFLIE